MPWPTPTDFRHAIQDTRSALDDEELRHGEATRNARGLPMLWSGNFASVYRIHCPATGKTWALKCFTREVSTRQERYRQIAACLKAARHAGVGVGHEGRRPFVGGQNRGKGRIGQGVEQFEGLDAGDAEDPLHAKLLQGRDQRLRARAFHDGSLRNPLAHRT